jgi:DNA-directed RNA polymerase subunit RPC12/RpoP
MACISGKSIRDKSMGEMFIYKCKVCGIEFDMYHLVLEPVHEIICPECGCSDACRMVSHEHKGALPKKMRGKKKKKKEE